MCPSIDWWRYRAFRLLSRIVPHVGEAAGYRVAGYIADALFLFAWRSRALVCRNLTQALGPKARRSVVRRLARQVFRNLLWNYYEMFRLPAGSLSDLTGRTRLEGVERAHAVMGQGRSAILVFPHIGNLEVLGQIPLFYPEYRFVGLVERMKDDSVFGLMKDLRASQGLQVVAATEMLRIRRLLDQGWNLILAGDFDSTGSGILVDFFGAPARMPDGAVRLALRTGAPLLIGYGWREPADPCHPGNHRRFERPRYRGCILPPVQLTSTGDSKADARRGVQEVVRILEPIIASHLDQWLAFHPFWPEMAR